MKESYWEGMYWEGLDPEILGAFPVSDLSNAHMLPELPTDGRLLQLARIQIPLDISRLESRPVTEYWVSLIQEDDNCLEAILWHRDAILGSKASGSADPGKFCRRYVYVLKDDEIDLASRELLC